MDCFWQAAKVFCNNCKINFPDVCWLFFAQWKGTQMYQEDFGIIYQCVSIYCYLMEPIHHSIIRCRLVVDHLQECICSKLCIPVALKECTGQLLMHCLATNPDLIIQSFELILSYFGRAEYLQVIQWLSDCLAVCIL